MDAGILNRRVTIDRNVTTQDSSGDPVADWQAVATVWAAILPLTGREADVDNDILAEADTRIRMRYSPVTATLTPKHRIRYANRHGETIYNIVHVGDVDGAHDEMRVDARSGLSEG
jgi:SPP1 family predicted phage head-tail adaptor